MATVTKENIGLLNEKLTLKLEKTDYLPTFEKSLKDYSKKANIPGFRKGMVPAGLIKKMYGPSLFTDEGYIDKMMQDRKYVEDAYNRIQGQKVFDWAGKQVKPIEKEIAMEDFVKMQEEHQHHHH